MEPHALIDQINALPFSGSTAAETARQEFLAKFPISRITSLSDIEYNGKKVNDSFCYNLEFMPDLYFGIGGRSKYKFGRTASVPALTRGIKSMIDDADSGVVDGLRAKHGLESVDQDVLIKILCMYLPGKFIAVGKEYVLNLLASILGIDYSDKDLIRINYRCNEELVKLNPGFSSYQYDRLGSAIWSILYPHTREGFEKWLKTSKPKARKPRDASKGYVSGTSAKSYSKFIEYLSYYYKENYFSNIISERDLDTLYNQTSKHQTEKGGTYYSPQETYGKGGYFSAAVGSLSLYLKSLKTASGSGSGSKSAPESEPDPSSRPHNIILYGPPGTGKTYNSIRYAVSIIEEIDVKSILGKDSYIDSMGSTKDVKEAFDSFVKDKRISFITFHQSFSYEDFIEGLKPEPDKSKKNVLYNPVSGVFKEICEEARNKEGNYVLIIDEINRGNVSQIFGELITLIEEDKREGTKGVVSCTLPYSHVSFCVPKNLYIIGTMNTADRSVEALDTALRRRFDFIEMLPNSKLVTYRTDIFDLINKRIEVLKDAEHQIGHSYFMKVKDDAGLQKVFQNKIIPLLQEYFYGDTERIRLVIGKGFFHEDPVEPKNLFPGYSGDIDIPRSVWRIWGKDDWENSEKDPSLFTNALVVLKNGVKKTETAETEEEEEQS